jgi:hypothetical protein
MRQAKLADKARIRAIIEHAGQEGVMTENFPTEEIRRNANFHYLASSIVFFKDVTEISLADLAGALAEGKKVYAGVKRVGNAHVFVFLKTDYEPKEPFQGLEVIDEGFTQIYVF